MAKAKKANRKSARPAKKAPARKAVAKPVKKPQKAAVAKKKPKRPEKKKVAPAPASAPEAAVVSAVAAAPPVAAVVTPAIESRQPSVPAPELTGSGLIAEHDAALPARKKGVRKATIATGVQDPALARRLGRSRIPVDAPLDVVFQNDTQAREAFSFLGIHSIRELEAFTADDLVLRLTGPAKLTVGRIRKILAMNNRCLTGDEDFAVEFQELHTKARPE